MAQLLMVNPRKRRTARKTRSRAKNPAKRRTYRRNPIGAYTPNPRRRRSRRSSPRANIMTQVMDASMMAGGAVAVDLAAAYLPIPADIKTGPMAPLVRAGIAIGLGMVVDKGLRQKALGRKMTEGSLVVIAHDFITKQFGSRIGLSAYEEMAAYNNSSMGDYGDNLLGYDDLLLNTSLQGNNGMLGNQFDNVVDFSGYENAAVLANYD